MCIIQCTRSSLTIGGYAQWIVINDAICAVWRRSIPLVERSNTNRNIFLRFLRT